MGDPSFSWGILYVFLFAFVGDPAEFGCNGFVHLSNQIFTSKCLSALFLSMNLSFVLFCGNSLSFSCMSFW